MQAVTQNPEFMVRSNVRLTNLRLFTAFRLQTWSAVRMKIISIIEPTLARRDIYVKHMIFTFTSQATSSQSSAGLAKAVPDNGAFRYGLPDSMELAFLSHR